jgi:hypothetical protein
MASALRLVLPAALIACLAIVAGDAEAAGLCPDPEGCYGVVIQPAYILGVSESDCRMGKAWLIIEKPGNDNKLCTVY